MPTLQLQKLAPYAVDHKYKIAIFLKRVQMILLEFPSFVGTVILSKNTKKPSSGK
jgi:hypothetical protein